MSLEKCNTKAQRNQDTKSEDEISHQIIGASIEVHRTLGGPGLLESIYEAVGDVHQEGGILMGNVDYLRQILAEDIEWIHPALGGAYHGIDSVINDVLIPFWKTWQKQK